MFIVGHDAPIKKWNTLISSFRENRLELNFGKSSFMIIHPMNEDLRINIKIDSGWLSYKNVVVYLGAIISDNGSIHNDINLHVADRNKSVYVKLANFIRNNNQASVVIKLKVLKACLEGSLLYETWSGRPLQKVETLYRKALKLTLSMNVRTPTEIVYIESGLSQLNAKLYKRQYLFWKKMMKEINEDGTTTVANIFKTAIAKNIHYLRHYQTLHSKFISADVCYDFYVKEFFDKIKLNAMTKTATERNSILNDYVKLNIELVSPAYYRTYMMNEYDRLINTKYRSGSHFLKIQTGRYTRIDQSQRLCQCGQLQTLHHVIFECDKLDGLRDENIGNTLKEFFDNSINAAAFLRIVEKVLNLR